MADTLTIEDIKARHEALYDRALQEAPKLRRSLTASTKASPPPAEATPRPAAPPEGNGSQAFLSEIKDLLANLTQLSSQVSSLEDYRWLSHAAVKWQNVFAFLDVPTFVQLNPPSDRLLPPAEAVPATAEAALSEQELDYWIKTHSELFAFTRIARLRRYSTQEEMEDDRHMAFVFLASDILDGRISFVKRIAPSSYWHLCLTWMEDLKHLRAYLLWLERGGKFEPFQMRKNYFDVCDHLRTMLTDAGIKAPAAAFEPVKRYLVEQYLPGGKIDAQLNPHAAWLVGHKALRLYHRTGRTDGNQNWYDAEAYVKTFYENIIAAVAGDYESTLGVLRALQCDSEDPRSPYQIIDAFEATLATYFLRPELIQKVWGDCNRTPSAGHASIISTVAASSWPTLYEVPANCAGRFEVAAGQIRFRGAMSGAQKEALLAPLTVNQQRAVEALYERSRTVCRETTL